MNRSVLNRTLLNTSVLCQSRLNQSGLASLCGKSGGIPSAIRRAMVLWYDIERQGCTNENMAENPILKDLSGNGYDARCYNFGWTEESGISTTNYPNALVSDGVDDYCLAEGLPLLTREKGYTVVARRKWFTNEKATAFVAKNTNSNGVDGGFQFEFVNGAGNNFRTSSFSSNTDISDLYTSEEAIVYQTSKNYNGQKNLTPKAVSDTGGMALFRFSVDESYLFGQFALYTLLLFNRDLTEDEINWVKTNLITV